ncbi:MAG TPA: hypothetical protein VF032_18480 [Thermoleophilaceae bacterium]
MEQRDGTVEAILNRLATPAFGLVKRRELLRAKVSNEEIRTRLQTGALLWEYRGIYRVGHRAASTESTYLAAVWACGDRAFLRCRAAGFLMAVLSGRMPAPEVLAPTDRRVDGVSVKRYRSLHPADVTRIRGIPITTVERTLVDLAEVLQADELARACHEASVRYGTTPEHVEAVLSRRPNSPGASKLRSVLRGDTAVLLSKLEEGFHDLLRNAGLPLPQTNRPVGGWRVDCHWPEYGLVVELDSYRYHNTRESWERDRLRERDARARGNEFRRYSWGDVFERSAQVEAELRPLLSMKRPN